MTSAEIAYQKGLTLFSQEATHSGEEKVLCEHKVQ